MINYDYSKMVLNKVTVWNTGITILILKLKRL